MPYRQAVRISDIEQDAIENILGKLPNRFDEMKRQISRPVECTSNAIGVIFALRDHMATLAQTISAVERLIGVMPNERINGASHLQLVGESAEAAK